MYRPTSFQIVLLTHFTIIVQNLTFKIIKAKCVSCLGYLHICHDHFKTCGWKDPTKTKSDIGLHSGLVLYVGYIGILTHKVGKTANNLYAILPMSDFKIKVDWYSSIISNNFKSCMCKYISPICQW